ncbi:MAG: hypothetical protein JNJ60_20845, partial [Rhodocyclaceae bacterium]|nr:hypothetical protein [Rhodocyclaceae bacterium]
SGRNFDVGTPEQLADFYKRPNWNRSGRQRYFHVDHIVELQVSGANDIGNMELLEAGANEKSGEDIRDGIESGVKAWMRKYAKTLPEADQKIDVDTFKRRYRINFTSFKGAFTPAKADYWSLEEIDKGDAVDFDKLVNIYDPLAPKRGKPFARWPRDIDPKDYTGSPSKIVIYPRETGGNPLQVPWPAEQEGDTRKFENKRWIKGLHIESVVFHTDAEAEPPGALRGKLFNKNPALAFNGCPVEIPLERKPGLPYAGFIRRTGIQRQIASIFKEEGVASLSPVDVQDFDIDDEKGALLTGRILPGLSLLEKAAIDVVIEGDDLRAEKVFSGGDLGLGGPFTILGSDFYVGLGTKSGLKLAGGVDFEIRKLGRGRIEAGAQKGRGGAGGKGGFEVSGQFDFDRELFDADASIRMTYARTDDAPKGKLSGEGDLSIGAGKIRGIKSAQVHALFDGDTREITGTADLDIPGIESASLGVRFDKDGA